MTNKQGLTWAKLNISKKFTEKVKAFDKQSVFITQKIICKFISVV